LSIAGDPLRAVIDKDGPASPKILAMRRMTECAPSQVALLLIALALRGKSAQELRDVRVATALVLRDGSC